MMEHKARQTLLLLESSLPATKMIETWKMEKNIIVAAKDGIDTNSSAYTYKGRINLIDQLQANAQKLIDQKLVNKKAKMMHVVNDNGSYSLDQLNTARKPLVPLFVSRPALKVEALCTWVSCSYQVAASTDNNTNIIYDCESANFTSIQFGKCNANAPYTYTVFNQITQAITLVKLIDGSFSDIIDQSIILPGKSEVSYEKVATIDICKDAKITQQVVGIGSLVNDKSSNEEDESTIPFACKAITYLTMWVHIHINFGCVVDIQCIVCIQCY